MAVDALGLRPLMIDFQIEPAAPQLALKVALLLAPFALLLAPLELAAGFQERDYLDE